MSHDVSSASRARLAAYDRYPPDIGAQHQALLAIKGLPGREEVTVVELAEPLNRKHHRVVGLVNRLMGRGLTQRRHDELRRLAPLLRAVLERLEAAESASTDRTS